MSATSHFLEAKTETRETAQELGFASLISLVQRFVGVALIFAGIGMWLAPGSSFSGEIALMKLGVTAFFALTGIVLFASGQPAEESTDKS